jgi:MFS family permease
LTRGGRAEHGELLTAGGTHSKPTRRRARNAARTIFKSLEIRNFRLYFGGQLISQTGSWLTKMALTLLVLHLTSSGLAIGALAACQFGPVLLFGVWGGLIADRHDKRRLLILTQTLEMGQSFGLGALAFMPHPPLTAFYMVALAGGCMLAFDNPARRSLVPEMVPQEYVQNAVTLNSAVMTSARIFGPAVAGLLIVTVGYGWCFTLDGLSYIAVIAALWLMRPLELTKPTRTAKAKGQVRAGFRYVRSVPDLCIPLVMMTVIGCLTFNFPVVLPLFVERTLHGTDGTYTIMYSILSIGSFAAALVAAHRSTMTTTHVVSAAFAFGLSMLLLAAAPTLPLALPTALVVGFFSIAFMTAAGAVMQVRADPVMRGRVFALHAIVIIGSTPIGAPLLGYICDTYGSRAGVAVGGLAALVAAAWGRYATNAGDSDSGQITPSDRSTASSSAECPSHVP